MKIFVASSGYRKVLAQALCEALKEAAGNFDMDLEIVPWPLRTAFRPGESTLSSLFAHCRGSDFFAVLLTADDMVKKKEVDGGAPRDNCVFELGLFIGGLEFDTRRCFMISSVPSERLPTDLAGLTLLPFKEPEKENLNSPLECKKAIGEVAKEIRNNIQVIGPYERPSRAAASW